MAFFHLLLLLYCGFPDLRQSGRLHPENPVFQLHFCLYGLQSSCFVSDIGNIGSRETRRLLGQERDIHISGQFQRFQVHFENFFPVFSIPAGRHRFGGRNVRHEARRCPECPPGWLQPGIITPELVSKPSISVSNWFSVFFLFIVRAHVGVFYLWPGRWRLFRR